VRARGVTYGLAAALAWGISTIAAAQATRRLTVYAALLTSQLLGAAFLALLAAAMRPSFTSLHGLTLVGLVVGGLLSLLGWLTYYLALQKGPVGVVGAVAATYGGVAAVLAVLVLGERLSTRGDAGVVLAVGGVCLAAAQSSGRRVTGSAARSGVFLAVVSALTYGVGAFAIGGYSARAGWLTAAMVAYGSSVAALLLVLPFQLRGGLGAAEAGRPADAPALSALVLHHERHAAGLATNGSGPAVLADAPALAALVLHHERHAAGLATNGSGPAGLGRATQVMDRPADAPALAALVLHHERHAAGLATNGSGPGLRPGQAGSQRIPAGPAAVNRSRKEGPISLWHRPGHLPGFAWAAVAGLAEGAALVAFSRGGEAGQVMVTSAVSSLYPVIPLAAGLLLFRERLQWRQVLGVFVIVAGLVMISLG
jgi:drug/metabolite transporter (DMT)-like permease